MSEFLFLGISRGHPGVFPPASRLELWHCRFSLNQTLGCAHPEAVARYARHIYLGFGRNVFDHVAYRGNADCGIAHFAVLIDAPEQWPFNDAGETLVFFNGLDCPLLEIDFLALCFLVSL